LICDSSNQPTEVVGIWADITERKRAKETLRQSEERFRQLAENITDVFWICSPDLQKVLYVSPAYERVWGRSAERLREHPQEWFEAILPEERERVAATYGRLTNGEPSVSLEYRITRPGGEVRWIHSRGFQVRDAAGKVIRITGVASDINDRKLAEAELLWKTAFLEAQVDSSLDGILVVNSKGKQLLRNQRMNQLWKIPPDFHTERNDRKLLQFVAAKVKNPEAFIREVENLYAHPDEVSRVEVELIDGTILDRYSSPVVGIDGTFYGRIWAFRDVTDSKQAERRLATQAPSVERWRIQTPSNEATPKIMQAICESEGWDFGAIWEVDKNPIRLRCLEAWHGRNVPPKNWRPRPAN
jgi:PAS domain S-box-containing protein